MTSAGGPPPGTSGYSGPGGSPTAPAHAAASGGGNGLAAEVHTLERAIFEVKR
ncbi:MAG: ATPase, partial [Mycobacterium sp.]